MPPAPKHVYSTHEVARICRVTPMTVIRWIEDGRLHAFKTAGGHRRIPREDLERFCQERGIPSEPPEAGRRRIIVVAADAGDREQLVGLARGAAADLEVEVARDAFEAGRLLGTNRPHLLILDERVCGVDVRDICERLKADPQLAATEILVFGPGPDDPRARDLRTVGAHGCLRRPLDKSSVRSVIRSALGLSPGAELRRTRVLVVDDDPLQTRALQREFERRGIEVLTAENGVDALLLIGSARPDLVVLDVMLPDIDGVEVVRRMRARPETAEVNVVAISGRADEPLRRRLLSAGAVELLLKPVVTEQLLQYLPQQPAANVA